MILTLIIATHACMLTCICSSAPYRYAFNAKYNALLPLTLLCKSTTSVLILAPLYFPRKITRPVSYYAIFKGWLLLYIGVCPSPFSALPLIITTQRYTSIYFEENQLSRCLIGLSPLSTSHQEPFQWPSVRSSAGSYTGFNLLMDRSHRFGSAASD